MWFCCVGLRQKNELKSLKGLLAPECWQSDMCTVSFPLAFSFSVGNNSVSCHSLVTGCGFFWVRWNVSWNCSLQFFAMICTLSPFTVVKKVFGSKAMIASVTYWGCNTPHELEVMKSSMFSFLRKSLSAGVSWYFRAGSMLKAYKTTCSASGPLFMIFVNSVHLLLLLMLL